MPAAARYARQVIFDCVKIPISLYLYALSRDSRVPADHPGSSPEAAKAGEIEIITGLQNKANSGKQILNHQGLVEPDTINSRNRDIFGK